MLRCLHDNKGKGAAMDGDSGQRLLGQLLQACDDLSGRASRLAALTALDRDQRALFQQRAVQYRRAATEIRAMLTDDPTRPTREVDRLDTLPGTGVEETLLAWESAESHGLTCFRDAYDARLPAPLAATIKRHFENGLAGYEQLRVLLDRASSVRT